MIIKEKEAINLRESTEEVLGGTWEGLEGEMRRTKQCNSVLIETLIIIIIITGQQEKRDKWALASSW